MQNLRVGVIFQRKKFLTGDGVVAAYKAIGYGYCTTNSGIVRFYSGEYNKQEFNVMNPNDDIAVIPFNIERFISFGFSSIDNQIKKWYLSEINDQYFKMDFNKFSYITIEDSALIKKCRKAFGDDIIVDDSDQIEDLCIDEDGDLIDENEENTFLQYDIEEKYNFLKKHVFGQDEQLKEVLSCIIKNLNLADSGFSKDMVSKLKSNILLLGKTGVGKTLMIKEIAKLLGVPYVIEDATRYTGSGWSGEDVENMLRNLYVASNKNITNAQMGILVVDEFDKLCNRSEKSTHSTTTVQQSLLKLVEGTKINISKNNHTDIGGFEFDTSKLTIIFAGAFDGIDKIIEKRTNEKQVGFKTKLVEEKDKNIIIEDLIEYGVISECAGRMSNIIELNNPTKEDLKNAFLYSKSSTLNLLEEYLKTNGIKIEFDEAFIDAVINKSITLKTGYRGLNQTLNKVIEKELYDIMTGKEKVLSLTSEKVK